MKPRKLLLAEDDEDDQYLFNFFLQDRDDIVLMPVVENGVALFDLLDNITDHDGLPDLIILDQNMPKRNGLQTLQLLGEMNRYSHIPVVVYSTYTDQYLIDICTAKGASAVVSKPVTKEGYDKMIDGLLKKIL